MGTTPLIKVTSPSFSRNRRLRAELTASFPAPVFNETGEHFRGPGLAEFLVDAEGAVIGLETVDEFLISRCPRLRIVAKYGVGLDNVDLDVCRRRNVAVGWTGGVNKRSVAEIAVGFILGLAHNLHQSSWTMRQGLWQRNGGVDVGGRTVGLIGVGHIGKEVAKMLAPFGCRLLLNDIVDVSGFAATVGATIASKREIYSAADFISLHVPLTAETRNMIDHAALELFRNGAFLINTSRGDVVDLAALKRALGSNRLAGAALDVFPHEPPDDQDLVALPNLVCTPHIAGNSVESVEAMGMSAIGHLVEFFGARQAG